ncbi:MAG: TetR/AcrR family transcriptional regulator [Propionibacteriaceae bacterium]|jgi:AcrR family transcriptional regulator|nr:TetR/AcrR family transcriptional regulator [Propionibacteriaceae bacterium]
MARKVKPPEQRKLEIVGSAKRLFGLRGYAKTTITEIIEDAEISKGLFYYYFGSKEEILDEIVNQLVEEDVAALKVCAARPAPAPDRLVDMVRQHRALFVRSEGHIKSQLRAINNPEIGIRAIRLAVVSLTPLLADVVREGLADGCFQVDDPDGAVELLLFAATFEAAFGPAHHASKRDRALLMMMERTLGAPPGAMLSVAARTTG